MPETTEVLEGQQAKYLPPAFCRGIWNAAKGSIKNLEVGVSRVIQELVSGLRNAEIGFHVVSCSRKSIGGLYCDIVVRSALTSAWMLGLLDSGTILSFYYLGFPCSSRQFIFR
jgi:hypothetical protein